MAEPWTDDLAALGTQSRIGLRSPETTRAACDLHERKPKMRFFKAHPALATLLVVAILGLFAPVAYAIVDRVFLSVDVSKSEGEIEKDLQEQLNAAGHGNATVKATKTDHEYTIAIESDNPALAGNLDLQIAAGGKTYDVHLELPDSVTEAQGMAVGEAASKALQREHGETDAEVQKQIVDDLARHGMTDVTVKVHDAVVSIAVRK